jgi:hypothetical protein
MDEMDLVGRFREVESLPAEVAERAELVLRAVIAVGEQDPDHGRDQPGTGRRRQLGRRRPGSRQLGRRRPGSRRTVAGLIGAAAATALTVAGATTFAGHRPAWPGGPTVSSNGSPAGVETVSVVVDRVAAALRATTGSVWYSQVRIYGAEGVFLSSSESWIAPKTAAFRDKQFNAAHTPISGMLVTLTPPGQPTVYVDYTHHVWTTRQDPPTKVALGFGGFNANLSAGGDAASVAADAIRSAHASGELRLAGHGSYDGHPVIELQEVVLPGQPNTWGGGSNTIWVDADTFLPIHEVITGPREPQSGAETYDLNFRWFPPTSTNLGLVTKADAVPPGFTEVRPDEYPGTLPNPSPH